MKKLIALIGMFLPALLTAQNVGINNDGSQPDTSAILDIKSTTKGLLIPRMTTAQRNAINPPVIGLTVFDTDTYSFWMYRGDVNGGWAEIQHQYQNLWNTANGHVYSAGSGNVGIGTNNPQEKLSLNAANPSIQLLNSGSAKGYINVTANDLRVGTYNNNTTGNLIFTTRAVDRIRIDENGLVGIGTGTGTAAFTLNGANPSFQLRNADVNKGFLRVSSDNIVLGTNSTNAGSNIIFSTLETEKMRLTDDGYLGLGSTAPNAKLHINSTSTTDPALRVQINGTTRFTAASNGGAAIGGLFTPPANGLRVIGESYFDDSVGIGSLSPTAMLTLNKNTSSSSNDFPNIDFKRNNIPVGIITGEFFGSSSNTEIDFQVKNLTSNGRSIISASNNTYGLVVHPAGRTSIGTIFPGSGYKLSVDGDIVCEDLTIQNSNNWPDYVFEQDYHLMPLDSLRLYLQANKHLPNIPSAAEVEKEGIQLKMLTKGLMEKVEELTLYILKQQEQIEALEKQMQAKRQEKQELFLTSLQATK